MAQKRGSVSNRMSSQRPSKPKPQKPSISVVQQRQHLKILDNGLDMTPKLLTHRFYATIKENVLTAYDAIGNLKTGSESMMSLSSAGFRSSLSIVKSKNLHTTVIPPLDETMESLIATQEIQSLPGESRAPSPFSLPRFEDPSTKFPDTVTIVLRETETMILFEMPQLTADLDTPEGQGVKEENERYEMLTREGGPKRKLADAETQTRRIHLKSRSTHRGREKRMNQGTFVNNWVIHDTYVELEGGQRVKETPDRTKLPKLSLTSTPPNAETQLAIIYEKSSFKDALQIMERIIASNLFVIPQKRFKGLLRSDPCSLELTFTYSLDLLWIHSCSETTDRPVTAFRWNYTNSNILAVGYGSRKTASDGLLLIWCMKNPSQPDRTYRFESAVADLDWSRSKPNQLAVGFYDGSLRVIDVSSRLLAILRDSKTDKLRLFSPHWQVQWWQDDDHLDSVEEIYTTTQDGRILRYPSHEDFTSTEMMRIPRIEAEIPGVARRDFCEKVDISITRNPGAVILRRHPDKLDHYLVGTDEGCVHTCSINYLDHHVDSFLAHDGPIYALQFSPFISKLFLTCGADWTARIWAESITEPLITLSTRMSCVRAAAWSPKNSTILATCADNEISIWDIKRRTYKPSSRTLTPGARLCALEFTSCGDQLVVADIAGGVYVYQLEGMPFPPFNQVQLLAESVNKALTTKIELRKKFLNVFDAETHG
ncbi:WD repeat-containing protein 78-like [Fopius arisanus]|uniref:Dynein axonemal intermediate chain 4 n=1 Tax=Fopius arisanus TaxID=64838 RepID=A0A9R1TFS2_9HYME|nr:PREDICTED: WD repeat-containing protein 78-like [Fopius arisanus]